MVGAVVANVIRNSPAERAGLTPLSRDENGTLKLGDIIIAADDTPINDGDDLLNFLDEKQPGDTIHLRILNNGEERTVSVKLGLLQ